MITNPITYQKKAPGLPGAFFVPSCIFCHKISKWKSVSLLFKVFLNQQSKLLNIDMLTANSSQPVFTLHANSFSRQFAGATLHNTNLFLPIVYCVCRFQ